MTPRLLPYRALIDGARSRHELEKQIRDGGLVRIRRGVYARGSEWTAATPEERAVGRARALQLTCRTPAVFSHETAAALLGLPLYRPDRTRTHLIVSDDRPGAAADAIRHRGALTDDEIVDVDGLRCTNLVRTVADVSRSATFEQAVVVADAALRSLCVRRVDQYDQELADSFAESVLAVARRSAHGLSRSGRVMGFADGRAQLPGESVSRIRLQELGFRAVRLQVAVPAPGTTYFVDFGLDEVHAFGEFDGAIKYVDGRMRDGRTSAEVFDAEKQREDWIRGRTRRPLVRWGWRDIETAAALGTRLAAFGIRPPR